MDFVEDMNLSPMKNGDFTPEKLSPLSTINVNPGKSTVADLEK